jgi:hypothetical protein
VSLGAVFTTKRPQQKKGKNDQLEQSPPVRTANVKAFAGWTAPK